MHHPGITEVLVVTTTVGNMDDALQLARRVVEARVAACVQVDAIAASVYRWEGQVCEEPEVRLTLKAAPAGEAALRAFLAANHPYEVPQLTWTRMHCTPEYGAWLASNASGA